LLVPPTKTFIPKPFLALPNSYLWGSCDLWENLSGGLREMSLCEHLSIDLLKYVEHLLLLEVKPPKRLDILELSSLWWALGNFYKGSLHLRKERSKIVDWEKRLKKIWLGVSIREQFKFSQQRRRKIGSKLLNFDKQNIVFIFWFTSLNSCLNSCILLFTRLHV
jgi:hypothetical protein